MKLRYDPFPLVFEQGDAVTQLVCLVFFRLGDTPRALRSLLELLRDQRADGTFPSQFDREQWGMQETVRGTLFLVQGGMPPRSAEIGKAVEFILAQQRPEGGWCENPALPLPPEATWLSSERGITWLTADAVDLLRRVGLGESRECKAALEWLRAAQNQCGGWSSLGGEAVGPEDDKGDPDSTAQIAFLMGEVCGEDDAAYRAGRALFEDWLDECARDAERGYWIRLRDGAKQALEVYHLTHLLLSWVLDPPRRFRAGYDAGDSRVRRMMEALAEVQGEDGGWRPFFSDASEPVYTVIALRALVLSGLLSGEALRGNIALYAEGGSARVQ